VKKYLISFLVLVGILCLGVSSCRSFGYVEGTGPVVNQTYDLTDYKNVEISNAFGFGITRSDNYSVTVSAHQNIFDHIEIKKSGDSLIVRMKPGSYTNSETRAIIGMPDLSSLNVSGASRGSVKGFRSSNSLNITSSGASQTEVDIEAGKTQVEISGASKFTGTLIAQDSRFNLSGASTAEISGSASQGNIEASGASRFNSPTFKMQNTTVSVSGASTAKILTSGTLNIEASGASTVTYSGAPQIKGLNVSGASHVSGQ
jgi:hypothetical protein